MDGDSSGNIHVSLQQSSVDERNLASRFGSEPDSFPDPDGDWHSGSHFLLGNA
jgi:hypothetical protein